MQQWLLYGGFSEFDDISMEDILNTDDDIAIGYVALVDLKYPNIIKERTKFFLYTRKIKR